MHTDPMLPEALSGRSTTTVIRRTTTTTTFTSAVDHE
jgi:hypothetical protein